MVAYSPLGKGFLTGKIDENTRFSEGDIRNILPRYTEEACMANKALLSVLDELVKKKNATTAQIALSWALHQKDWIVPIPGTTKIHRLKENIGAANLHLATGELAAITAASEHIKIVGDRYPEYMDKSTGL